MVARPIASGPVGVLGNHHAAAVLERQAHDDPAFPLENRHQRESGERRHRICRRHDPVATLKEHTSIEGDHVCSQRQALARFPRRVDDRERAGLIELSKRTGVRGGVAVNALDSTLAVRDPNARLWPQTELLKAALLAEALTGSSAYATIAANAASTLMKYLTLKCRGCGSMSNCPAGNSG